jgi:hypothetical protein
MRMFLHQLEDDPTFLFLASAMPAIFGDQTIALLRREGALEHAGRSSVYPCGQPGMGERCPRDIVESTSHGLPILRAVCRENVCPSITVTEEEAEALALNRRAWVDLLRRLYGLDGPVSFRAGRRGVWSIGHANGCDWFLSLDRFTKSLLEFALDRESHPRRTRILLPTVRRALVVQRCRLPTGVELGFLEEELAIEGDRIVLVRRPAVAVADASLPKPPVFSMPSGTGWRDVRVYRVDGHTVSVRAGSIHKRLTYGDLGMASEKTREPTRAWEMLMALCEGGGTLRWHGDAVTVKRQVSTLRANLKDAFGLAKDPFAPYAKAGWRSQFAAYPTVDEERGEISPPAI